MIFIVRNQAKIANKYLRFAKWKIRKLTRKFGKLLYSEIYVNQVTLHPTIYDVTIKMGVAGPDIIVSAQSSNLKELWSELSHKIKRQLVRNNRMRRN